MAIRVKIQKDYLRTEATVELPANVAELDDLLRSIKTSGKMVVLYNEGHVQGINIEQNTKISDATSTEVRKLLGIGDKVMQ